MANLEYRQEKVLAQLKEIKTKLMSMHKDLGVCGKPASKLESAATTTSNQTKNKILINVLRSPKDVRK